MLTFNEVRWSPTGLVFLLHILGILHASNGRSIHIPRIDSFSFTLKSLGSSPFLSSPARASNGRSIAGALVFVSKFFLLTRQMVVRSKERVGDGSRTLRLPI